MQYGQLYHTNYYKEVQVKNRVYYEYYNLENTQEAPEDYKPISFVCLRQDGCLELPTTLSDVCNTVAKKLEGFEGFHFHQLRHPYVKPKTKKYEIFLRNFSFLNLSDRLLFVPAVPGLELPYPGGIPGDLVLAAG
jgi:hypothetical protein